MHSDQDSKALCSECQTPMERWPALSGHGYLAVCPSCHPEPTSEDLDQFERDLDAVLLGPTPGTSRFREMVIQGEEAPAPDSLPEDLLEELPDDARRLLSPRAEPPSEPQEALEPETSPERADPPEPPDRSEEPEAETPPAETELAPEKLEATPTGPLPPQGTPEEEAVDEASAAVRSRGVTPEDVALLATELEGGASAAGDRLRCPECEAIISAKRSNCPWCGAAVPKANA